MAEKMDAFAVLMDDGVYAARAGQNVAGTDWTALSPVWSQHLAKGTRLYVHTPSARTRGMQDDEQFVTGAQWIEDDALAQLLAESDLVMVY